MDYNQSLQYLQNLLTNQQGINSNQFNQGMGLNQSILTQKGQQFDASLALQKVIADWQNQLANKQQTQSEQAQQFGQNQTLYNENPAVVADKNNAVALQNPNSAASMQVKNLLDYVSKKWPTKSPTTFTPASGYNVASGSGY